VRAAAVLLALYAAAPAAQAQKLTYRGFGEAALTLFPQSAPNDATQAIAEGQFRFEPSLKLRPNLSAAASFEARADSHDQTAATLTFWDRTLQRPALAIRTLEATVSHGRLTLELGKQFVRWGQSDIISPMDYFTPKDYLIPVSSDALATTAVRATVAGQTMSLELVYTPRMTPSRIPLLDQRWIGQQAAAAVLPLENGTTAPAGGPQYGVRWHHNARRLEYSATFFQGFNHLPVLAASIAPTGTSIRIDRRYPAVHGFGGDAVATLAGLTMRAEAAWLQARNDDADDYGLWVVQGERQRGEWLYIGGYVGEWVSRHRDVISFAPDRGLARSLIGRASYTSDSNRSLAIEAVARRNGDGFYAKTEYSRPIRPNTRVTLQFLLIRGDESDFLGQYRRNSFGRSRVRVSF
jgi:hypothetical protein